MPRGGGEVGARARTPGIHSLCVNLGRPPPSLRLIISGKGEWPWVSASLGSLEAF